MNRLIVSRAVTGAFGIFVHVSAVELGDSVRGSEYAQSVCAECHAVLPENEISPNAAAPSFKSIANNPGMSRTALIVWFQSPHPTMPQLVLEAEDLDNTIAYILSLKD